MTDAKRMAEAQAFIEERGYLPQGQTLSGLLSPNALEDYRALLADLPLNPGEMDRLQPWLAELTLSSSFYGEQDFSASDGADARILGYALAHKKTLRYLESPRQQLELLADSVGTSEVNSFETFVTTLHDSPHGINAATAEWLSGDVDRLSTDLQATLSANPPAKEALLDARNRAWASEIETMLGDGKTYFVTVGVGHLGGSGSVIDILCREGFRVLRLPTGHERVRPACSE
jgi:uncharacterized protein YbaP (TraB family)